MKLDNIEIVSIEILRGITSTDKIVFNFEGPTPYPELQKLYPNESYAPFFEVSVKRGYAETWLTLLFGSKLDTSIIKVIDVSKITD